MPGPKKPRLVFTDIQRRTLMAIFRESKRPSKDMQATIAEQLQLKVSTVANFFMNARRRSLDKFSGEEAGNNNDLPDLQSFEHMDNVASSTLDQMEQQGSTALTDLDTHQVVPVSMHHPMIAHPPPQGPPVHEPQDGVAGASPAHALAHDSHLQQHVNNVQAPPPLMQLPQAPPTSLHGLTSSE